MPHFPTNPDHLAAAAAVLRGRDRLLWLIGGACSGKSTVARALADLTGAPVYDMDEAFFGRYAFDPTRHPATSAWFSAANPLGWMLSLPWDEFDALYRAANAEMLERLAEDLRGRDDTPLIIDGGITHPSVLVAAVPPERIICLEAPEVFRLNEWETAANRAEMKQEVLALPDGPAMWERFLDYDRRMTATLARESKEAGIAVVAWEPPATPASLAAMIARRLMPPA